MKPIIINMNEVTDSVEMYNSKPNRAIPITIFTLAFMLVATIIWMFLYRIEIVVKNDGIFKRNEAVMDIPVMVSGTISDIKVENGAKVSAGDVLFTIENEELTDKLDKYEKELSEVNERIDALKTYEGLINTYASEFPKEYANKYKEEFENRLNLLLTKVQAGQNGAENQIAILSESVSVAKRSVEDNESRIGKLEVLKECLRNGSTEYPGGDSYYQGILNSYHSSFNLMVLQYDNQIADCNRQKDEYDRLVRDYEGKIAALNASSVAHTSSEGGETTAPAAVDNSAGLYTSSLESAKKQRDAAGRRAAELASEKVSALNNLNTQQVNSVEVQIEELKGAKTSLSMNLANSKVQLNTARNSFNNDEKEVLYLSEKNALAGEILQYEEKKKSLENTLDELKAVAKKREIKAASSGVFYSKQEISLGMAVGEGTSLGVIYPEEETIYHAELYIKNSDIAKVSEGQTVKFDIAALPSEDYGYFEGVVDSISKDVTVNPQTGQAYYIVKVSCKDMNVDCKEDKESVIMNGMACRGRIVIGEKTLGKYLLEKIDLTD